MPGYDSWKARSPDDDLGDPSQYEKPDPLQELADWEDGMPYQACIEAAEAAEKKVGMLRRVMSRKRDKERMKEMTDPKYMRPGLPFAVGKTVEELGELNAALGKTLRWGWDSVNPELPKHQRETNLIWVRREIEDVRGALDNLERELTKEFG